MQASLPQFHKNSHHHTRINLFSSDYDDEDNYIQVNDAEST